MSNAYVPPVAPRYAQYEDYGIDEDYTSVEQELLDNISQKIIEDVYNKAFVNW